MVSKEEVIHSMVNYFPQCPICKADASYEVSIWRGFIECKSCHAKWTSSDWRRGQQFSTLKLLKTDRQGKSKSFENKEKAITFWQSVDFEKFDPAIDKEVRELIEKVERKNDKDVNEAIARLREIGEPALYALDLILLDDREPSGGAIRVLSLLANKRAEEMLLWALEEERFYRNEVVMSLALIEETNKTGKLVEPLVKTLKEDEDPSVRATAAQALAFIRWDPRATEALIEALKDSTTYYSKKTLILGIEYSDRVSDVAALSLGKLGSERALEAMVPYALNHWHKKAAVEVFKHIEKPAIEHLKEYLNDERKEVREAAEASIKAIEEAPKFTQQKIDELKKKGKSAVESLIEALQDENDVIRQSAAYALRDMGDERALDALILATKDKSWFVRGAAKGAIKEIQKRRG